MGKAPDKADASNKAEAPAKAPRKAPARPRRRSVNTIKGDLEMSLADLIALASSDPYLVDAQAFLTQAVACLGKQVMTEGRKEPPEPSTGG
jgi:hypothetical protein